MKPGLCRLFIVSVILLLALSSCGGAAQTPAVDVSAVQTQAAQDVLASLTANAPTNTPFPTNTPQPTVAPTATTNPVPCASEDFSSADWVMVNNKGNTKFNISNGKIEIIAVGGDQDLYAGYNVDAPRIIKKIPFGTYEMYVRVTIPEYTNSGGFQASGLVLYFNTLNYAWVGLSSAQQIEAIYTLQGARKNFYATSPVVTSKVVYLGFKVTDMKVSSGYSEDGINYTWSTPMVFDTTSIRGGVTVLSAWPESTGYSGVFECFEVKRTDQ